MDMTLARVGLIVLAIVAGVAVVYAVFRGIDERAAPPIVIEDADALIPIVVDVRGEVVNPGVYELPPEARLQDAVEAAGGLTDEADRSTVNLARRLRDGEMVIVAVIPEVGTPVVVSEAPPPTMAALDEGLINLNTASQKELELLPEIGEVTAQRIIDYREANGPFRSVDDLIHIKGISTQKIDKLRNLVTTAP
jgi:competence protein ComEA